MSISSESIDGDITTDQDQQENLGPSVEVLLLRATLAHVESQQAEQLERQQMDVPTSSDGFDFLTYDVNHLSLSPKWTSCRPWKDQICGRRRRRLRR
uniref:Uncharacterized protein n=1 Tax=Globodera pallida TaxID=36090 RepID=A0A183BUH6_GLOPA